jgi:arsenite methyltransferase
MVEMLSVLKGVVMFDEVDIKEAVRDRYAGHASKGTSCGSPSIGRAGAASCGCSGPTVDTTSEQLGYDPEELAGIPDGADLGLGCGNPLAMLDLREGETVLDLGSGAGIDCFLAAKRVGPTGRVIGVDMTPDMLARARRNATDGGYDNVEFRLGEIEHLPVGDASIDAIISNCVVNLVPNKRQVFADAFRVLKPGGRLSVTDIVLLGEVPLIIRDSVDAYVSCLSGAILRDAYLKLIDEAGFGDIRVTESRSFTIGDVVAEDLVTELAQQTGATMDELQAAAAVFQSVRVQATKPV